MVLVVGAGPVGLTLAIALLRLGVAVRIVDENAARTDKSKALVLWSRSLELLDIEADGFVATFIAAGRKGKGARIFAEGKELLHLEFAAAPSDFDYALFIPQSETERLLETRLEALGTRVERLTTLTTFDAGSDGVSATLRRADGSTETVRCDWLVGGDGAHSTVRHGLGLEFAGSAMPGSWMLADVYVDGTLDADVLTLAWTRDGVLALFPIAGGRFRVLADIPAAAAGETERVPSLAEVQALLDARAPGPLNARDPVWLSTFRISERKVADYGRGRVFLAGDAAHIHSPAGGQGMNTGMQDAFNLAWKLALVSRGVAQPALLATYSLERSRVAADVLRNAGRMTEVAVVRNPMLQELRNLAASALGHLAAFRQRLVNQLSEVDIAYPESALTRPGGGAQGPRPGDRARDAPVHDAAGAPTRLHALLRGGRFVLLVSGGTPPAVPAALAELVTVATTSEAAHYPPGNAFLVRPDAYVAASAPAAGARDLVDFAGAFAA